MDAVLSFEICHLSSPPIERPNVRCARKYIHIKQASKDMIEGKYNEVWKKVAYKCLGSRENNYNINV